MPSQIRRISKKYLNDPEEITVKNKTTTSANTTQRYLMVSYPQKVDALTRILEVENFEGMIVFVRTKNETETLAEKLRARGFSAMAINGDVVQAQRERTVNQLKSGKLDILVATDVAARGLDVERISHVVNYDIPTDTESYVHRIGRTGRAGRSGDAISFVTPRERYLLKAIEKATRQPLDPDAAADGRRRQHDPAGALRRRDHPGARRRPPGSTSSATSSPTTSRPTTCPRPTSPPRSPWSCRATPRCCSTPRPSVRSASSATTAPVATASARPAAAARAPQRTGPSEGMATYRINVGKRHKVEPRQIVGAIANEGGLSRGDFGAHLDPPRLLAGRAARRPAARHRGEARRHPDLRQADRAAPRQGPPAGPRPAPGRLQEAPPQVAPTSR